MANQYNNKIVLASGDVLLDLTADTVTAASMRSGYTAHDKSGAAITGTMSNNGAVTATIDGTTTTSYAIPEGYHNGNGTVTLTNEICPGPSLIDESTATYYKRYFSSADIWLANSSSYSFWIDCEANKRYIITTKNPSMTIFRIGTIPYSTSDTLPTRPQATNVVRLTSCGAVGYTTASNAKGLVIQIDGTTASTRSAGLSIYG